MPRPLSDVMEEVGAFGRYQVTQLILSMICVLVGAANTLSFIVSNMRPIGTCPFFQNASAWAEAARATINSTDLCALESAKRNVCPRWIKLPGTMSETSITRFHSDCHPIQPTVMVTGFMIGFLIGSVAYGYVSDRLGRMRALTISSVHLMLATFLSSFALNGAVYGLSRFLAGNGAAGMITVALTYMPEAVLPRHRGYVGLLLNLPWSLSLLLLSLLGFLLHRSSKVELTLALLCLLPLLASVTIRESPRWLLTQKRNQEAVNILRLVARFNGRPVPVMVPSSLTEVTIVARRLTLCSLMRPTGVRSVAVLLWIVFFVISLVYYGVTVAYQGLAGWNLFTTIAVSAAIEFAGLLAVVKVLECTPRRWLLMTGFGLTSALCFAASGVASSDDFALSIVCLVARPVAAAVFSGAVLFAVEVFPTSHRTLGLGLCNAVARISALIAPVIHFMGGVWPGLPFVVYGITAIAAGLLFLLLPETRGKASPETLEDAEKLADDHVFRPCLIRRNVEDGQAMV